MINNGFILGQIKSYNRRLLLFTLLLLVSLAFLISSLFSYWYNLKNGPFSLELDTLNSLENVDSLEEYYVTVEGDDVYSIVKEDGYLLLDMYDGLLIIKGDTDDTRLKFTGELKNLSDDELDKVYNALSAQVEDMSIFDGALYPVYLDVGDFGSSRIIQYALAGLLLLLIIRNMIEFFKRSSNPGVHPLCRDLSRYGDIERMVHLVDCEVEKADLHNSKNNVLVTETWILLKKIFKLELISLSDVVWVYQKITTRRVNYIIPAGKTYELVIFTKDQTKHEMAVRKNACEDLISQIYQKAPWVLTGFSTELEKQWKKNRAELLKNVQDRFDQNKHQEEGSFKQG